MWAGPPVSSVYAPSGLELQPHVLSRNSFSSPVPIQKKSRWEAMANLIAV